ncbi:hypothetical protein F5884DRAFT_780304 [Xylogone sp. PMI_703]|nr:hypothetical protein F5884DRAFT_780304 [Xylogone sp. PMI_703]
MDPLSALSVAAAVIQFVDFTGRLFSDTYEVYTSPSGQKAELVQLSVLSNDIAELAGQVDEKSTALCQRRNITNSESQLIRLCDACKRVNTDLQNALDLLKARDTKESGSKTTKVGKSFNIALSGIWSHKKVKQMSHDLANIRQQIMAAILVCLWDESKRSQERDVHFSKQMDGMMVILNQLNTARDELLSREIIQTINAPQNLVRKELIQMLWDPGWDKTIALAMPTPGNTIAKESETLLKKRIVDSLKFEKIEAREETIADVYHTTCQWIFQDHPTEVEGTSLWSSYPTWLRTDSGQIYWITGKPGSGKSTLMKFITRHSLSKKDLQIWAGDCKLILASFYSWSPSSYSMQKSCEGLMRTLLYQALTLNLDLVPQVIPRRWALVNMLCNADAAQAAPEWGWEEIRESFFSVLSECGKSIRLALFIDGLDEFESSPTQILDLITEIKSYQGIKLCVASRPWIEFEDAFNHYPLLRMEQLTKEDIEFFTRKKLQLNQGFQSLKEICPNEADQLLEDIAQKAQGVFLWVSLVVRALLEGLTEGDKLSDLQETVRQLPSDLSKLYDHIWAHIRPRNIASASELFQLFQSAYQSLHYLTLWLADEKKPLETDMNSISFDARNNIKKLMRRRLDSRTRGILEISPNGYVDFLHRTARDWALQDDVRQSITSAAPDFDPYIALLQAEAIRIPDQELDTQQFELHYYYCKILLICLHYASLVTYTSASTPRLIRILDKIEIYLNTISARDMKINYWLCKYHRRKNIENDYNISYGFTILEIAAQYCITPYISKKISECRSLSQPDKMEKLGPILENAIFGPMYGVNQPLIPQYSIPLCITPARRLEFVGFLLENGIYAECKRSIPRILKLLNRSKRANDNYDKTVSTLLKGHMGLRDSLKFTLGF